MSNMLQGRWWIVVGLACCSLGCKRATKGEEVTQRSEPERNSKWESYMANAAKKEEQNRAKGWKHVEGVGYQYTKPVGWTETKDINNGLYFQLCSEDLELKIQLHSRYIEAVPAKVQNLEDWIRLQYSDLGMPHAVRKITNIEVESGEMAEAFITMNGEHLRSRSYTNIFTDPESKRFWVLLILSGNRKSLESPEVNEFLRSFRIDNFQW